MDEKLLGFTPSNYQDRIKPPLISFSLILVGLGLIAIGGGLTLVENIMNLSVLPTVMITMGFVLAASGTGYILGRKKHISVEKHYDEMRFYNWVKEHYGIVLSAAELEQLYEYNFTTINGKRYILHYEFEENEIIGHLLTDADMEEQVETGLINVVNHPIPSSNVLASTLDEEEELRLLEAAEELDEEISKEDSEETLTSETKKLPIVEVIEEKEPQVETPVEKDIKKPARKPAKAKPATPRKKAEIVSTTKSKGGSGKTTTATDVLVAEPASAVKPFDELTLLELKALARTTNIKGTNKMNKEELRKALTPTASKGGSGKVIVSVLKEPLTPEVEPTVPLDTLKLAELKALAKTKNIKGYYKMSKEELITALS